VSPPESGFFEGQKRQTKKMAQKREIMSLMKREFDDARSSSSSITESSAERQCSARHECKQDAMARELAILRLLKRNHNKKTALQQRLERDKKSAPVQVDPYMLKQLLEEL